MGGFIVVIVLAFLVIIIVAKTAVVVPQQSAFVVERLGKYSGTLGAGFHILVPFLDVIRYKHSLKEQAIDIPPQVCITRDNVQVSVDGVLYQKPRCAASSARSSSTVPSRSAPTSIPKWSANWTKRRNPGASK